MTVVGVVVVVVVVVVGLVVVELVVELVAFGLVVLKQRGVGIKRKTYEQEM